MRVAKTEIIMVTMFNMVFSTMFDVKHRGYMANEELTNIYRHAMPCDYMVET